jgi:hypothetical protein
VLILAQIQRDVQVYSALSSGQLPRRPSLATAPEMTDELWNFILHCWDDHPPSRPAMQEARDFLAQYERRQGTLGLLAEPILQYQPVVPRRRPSDSQVGGYAASVADSTVSRRRPSDVDINAPYTPSMVETTISSLYQLSPRTNISGTTAHTTPDLHTPPTVKPRSSSGSKVSSPPDLKLSSPYPSPPTLSARRDEASQLQVTSSMLGGMFATSAPTAPTFLPASIPPVPPRSPHRPSGSLWVGRIPSSSTSKLPEPNLLPPTVPMAPKHILEVTTEETDDFIAPGSDIERFSQSSAPPVPFKDALVPITAEGSLPTQLTASPESRPLRLPSGRTGSETSWDGQQPEPGTPSKSLWQRMRRRGSNLPAGKQARLMAWTYRLHAEKLRQVQCLGSL